MSKVLRLMNFGLMEVLETYKRAPTAQQVNAVLNSSRTVQRLTGGGRSGKDSQKRDTPPPVGLEDAYTSGMYGEEQGT